MTCLGVVITHQQHAPQPPPSGAHSGPQRSLSRQPAASHAAAARLVLPASAPLTIAIPAIRVHSSLQRLGLTAAGAMQVPIPGPHYDEAGWYKYSPTPGSLGPAVIVGHVDSFANGPSVFYLLGALQPGDRVLVTLADGSVAQFSVDAVRRYPKVHFPTQLVFGNTNHAALRLITCGGAFDSTTGHYLDNTVVLASLVGVHGGPPPVPQDKPGA
jgi:hypothetical protein